jgi:hypothetical protein
MNYTWTIAQLDREANTGGVTVAHWRVSAEDEGHTAGAYGTAGFTPDPESETFVPFEEVTEADVLEWIWAQESFNKDEIEENLAKQIETQKNPPTLSGLPWASSEAE